VLVAISQTTLLLRLEPNHHNPGSATNPTTFQHVCFVVFVALIAPNSNLRMMILFIHWNVLRSLTTILLEDYQRTFGVFASEVGWEVQAGVKNTPYTAKRKEAFVRRSNWSMGQFDIGESYTILDDALYEFSIARVQNQSNAEQPRNYNFSSRVAKELNEYFQPQLQKKFNCSTPCCEACGFELNWGKHMNDLFSSAITPHSHQNHNKAQYVGRTVRKKSMTKMNAGADFSSKLKIGAVHQQESKYTFCESISIMICWSLTQEEMLVTR
jgi:hypothetical protein